MRALGTSPGSTRHHVGAGRIDRVERDDGGSRPGTPGRRRSGAGRGEQAVLAQVGGVREPGRVADHDTDARAPVPPGGQLLDAAVVEQRRRGPLLLDEQLGEVGAAFQAGGDDALHHRVVDQRCVVRGASGVVGHVDPFGGRAPPGSGAASVPLSQTRRSGRAHSHAGPTRGCAHAVGECLLCAGARPPRCLRHHPTDRDRRRHRDRVPLRRGPRAGHATDHRPGRGGGGRRGAPRARARDLDGGRARPDRAHLPHPGRRQSSPPRRTWRRSRAAG